MIDILAKSNLFSLSPLKKSIMKCRYCELLALHRKYWNLTPSRHLGEDLRTSASIVCRYPLPLPHLKGIRTRSNFFGWMKSRYETTIHIPAFPHHTQPMHYTYSHHGMQPQHTRLVRRMQMFRLRSHQRWHRQMCRYSFVFWRLDRGCACHL